MTEYLETWEFGTIRIADSAEVPIIEQRSGMGYIRDDILGEWSYWQLVSGEIVAIHNWEEE